MCIFIGFNLGFHSDDKNKFIFQFLHKTWFYGFFFSESDSKKIRQKPDIHIKKVLKLNP